MGGKAPTTTQTAKTQLSPEQSQIFGLAFPYAQQYASKPIEQYAGSGIVGLKPDELAAQQQVRSQLPGLQANAGQVLGTQTQLLDPGFMLDVANNPYLQNAAGALTQQVNQNLLENQLPGIRTGSTVAGGQYSGGATRQGVAEGQAIGRTNQGLSNSIADMMFQGYNRGLTGLGQAVGQNPSVQTQQLFPASVQSAVGQQDRALEQAALDENIRKFYTSQALPFIQAQELMGLVSGMPGGQTVGQTTGSVPGVNPLVGALGGISTGAQLGSMFGPVGTGLGAAGGGLLSLLLNK